MNLRKLSKAAIFKVLLGIVVVYGMLIGISLLPHAALDLPNRWHLFQQPVKMAYSTATRTIIVVGTFIAETAPDLEEMFKKHPDAEYLLLSSSFSQRGVGQAIAEVVKRHQIKTLVVDYCYVACGYVFLAGKERYISEKARRYMIGFEASPGDFSAQETELNQLAGDRHLSATELSGLAKNFLGSVADQIHVSVSEDPAELVATGFNFDNPARLSMGAYGAPCGVFNQEDNSITLVRRFIHSKELAEDILAHEVYGHAAFWKFRDYEWLDRLADRRPDLIADRAWNYGFDITKKWGRRAAAEEAVAAIAGQQPNLTVLEAALVSHRAWLRANLFPNLYYSDAEVIFNYILPLRRSITKGAQSL